MINDQYQPQPALTMLDQGGPIPASFGRCGDLYHDVRALRLAMEKEVAKIQARESELKDHLIKGLAKSRDGGADSGAAGLRYRVQVVDKTIYQAKDWQALWAWIAAHGRFDMLQKRLGEKAVADFAEQNAIASRDANGNPITVLRPPPGVDYGFIPDLSVTKI